MGEHFEKFTEKQLLRRARVTALVLASATVISMIALVFAFIQKTEADKTSNLAIQCHEQLILVEKQAQQAMMNADQEQKRANEAMAQMQNALQQLEARKK